MSDSHRPPEDQASKPSSDETHDASTTTSGRMHQNVPVWSDPCCSCEAEPYWAAVAEEMENDQEAEKPLETKTGKRT